MSDCEQFRGQGQSPSATAQNCTFCSYLATLPATQHHSLKYTEKMEGRGEGGMHLCVSDIVTNFV